MAIYDFKCKFSVDGKCVLANIALNGLVYGGVECKGGELERVKCPKWNTRSG